MPRVVIAPDKFKGCLSAPDVARAMARAVAAAWPEASVDLVPMADGGEGTVEALVAATGGDFRDAIVTGPLGEPVVARFGLLGDGRTAVLEMASASGLVIVPHDRRDPMRATTFGTGELLLAALDLGVTSVILGIGGSATNDGGAGLGQALGARLLDESGSELPPGGAALARLDRIDASRLDPRLARTSIRVACDVANPLCGPTGASAVYGPQKGATPAMIAGLDAALARYARVVARDLRRDVADLPGAGAAGGLGAGLVAFVGGVLTPGIDLVIDAVGLAERLRGANLCLTGEGGPGCLQPAFSGQDGRSASSPRLSRGSLGRAVPGRWPGSSARGRTTCSARGSTPSPRSPPVPGRSTRPYPSPRSGSSGRPPDSSAPSSPGNGACPMPVDGEFDLIERMAPPDGLRRTASPSASATTAPRSASRRARRSSSRPTCSWTVATSASTSTRSPRSVASAWA